MELMTLRPVPFPKEQISHKLEANNILTNRYAGIFFDHPAFSTENTREMTIAIVSLGEIGLENGATWNEIFHHIEKCGFKPCPPNTGLFLRIAWDNQPRSQNSVLTGMHGTPEQAVVVFSEQMEAEDAFPKGLYLRNVDGRLWLRGYVCDSAYLFSGHDLFAFEKRTAEQG